MDQDINELKEKLERERKAQRLVNAYHRLFGTQTGKMVLEDLKERFGTDHPAFMPRQNGAYDPYHAAIRDGQRQVMLHIETLCAVPYRGDGNIEKPQTTVIK